MSMVRTSRCRPTAEWTSPPAAAELELWVPALPRDENQYIPKKGITFTLTAEALVRRLVALVPPPRRHLTASTRRTPPCAPSSP